MLKVAFPTADRRRSIWLIALPIMGGMMSQNILNLVDIGMVGRLGDAALAATGIGSFTNYLAISFIIGLSAGVQALASRRLGEGRDEETAVPLNGGLALALLMGVPACALLYALAPAAFTWLTDDPEVQALGTPYLQVRLLAMVAIGMNFSFRGYWSAIHMTGVYLQTLLIMHSINIFLNWVLIFGNLGAPELGVYGAGLATTISLYIGTALYFFFAWRRARDKGFLHRRPTRTMLWQQLKLSLPASIQQLFFSAGLVTLVWIVGRIGTAEVAAVNILMTFHITALLPAMGVALACTTLVGNALGRKDEDDALQWGWNCALLTFIYGLVLTLLLIPLARPLLGVFIHNPDTLELAYLPMVLWALMIGFDTAGMVLMNALIGAGDTRRAMWISVFWQWALFLPAAFIIGPTLGYGLLGVWIVNTFYRVGQAIHCVHQWRSRSWSGIEI
ncbi:MATE family efflux transporter [Marinihelvus fidelis]|uniref:Multidrug-efflux transporter n=1 Tax=Marinihelvus fidelis TaxID=2613842 RepID=A0A5N0T8L4_9GAMM|nr:MATE family efflux transporter [Marinihelvus fidelis]KAA9130487.1 MATE family efflux transporter [Marinihelvus fidelis]